MYSNSYAMFQVVLQHITGQVRVNSSMMEVTIYRNQSTDLLCKSMNWFLYDKNRRHEKVKVDVGVTCKLGSYN